MNDGQNNKWSGDSAGKISFRKIVVNILIEKGGTNTFFSYRQLAGPLDKLFRTKYGDNTDPLATIDEAVVKQAFTTPSRTNPYRSCSTIFTTTDDYSEYYVHIDKDQGRIACSNSVDGSSDFRLAEESDVTNLIDGVELRDDWGDKVKDMLSLGSMMK